VEQRQLWAGNPREGCRDTLGENQVGSLTGKWHFHDTVTSETTFGIASSRDRKSMTIADILE